jgi:hypothetical protein
MRLDSLIIRRTSRYTLGHCTTSFSQKYGFAELILSHQMGSPQETESIPFTKYFPIFRVVDAWSS